MNTFVSEREAVAVGAVSSLVEGVFRCVVVPGLQMLWSLRCCLWLETEAAAADLRANKCK